MTVQRFVPDIDIVELHEGNVEVLSIDELDDEVEDKTRVAIMFYEGVAYQRQLLREYQAIFKIGSSTGKDSSVIVEMAIEAYWQAIMAKEIPADHPLIIVTTNTMVEHVVYDMYSHYTVEQVRRSAKAKGIAIHYQLAAPSLPDQFASKYFGGDKLLLNPSLNSDCTHILKIVPGQQAINNVFDTLTAQQKALPVLDISGVRDEESARRAANIKKYGATVRLSLKQISELIVSQGVGKQQLVKLAPIKDWTKDDVWLYLDMCGTSPLDKDRDGLKCRIETSFGLQTTQEPGLFPYHLKNAALIRMVYGQASNERCNYVAGDKGGKGSAGGCGGKARYGCFICGHNPTDKTGENLMRFARWNQLGAEAMVRLHDWMARLSTDMRHRAFQARAVDTVGFHVALQPNIMKPAILCKLVRLCARITILNQHQTEDMRARVLNGTTHEHPGVKCIESDDSLTAQEKKQLIEMYVSSVCASPLAQVLTEEHAMYLSMRWAMDGIGIGFTPLAIYHETVNEAKNGGWKAWLSQPFPALNRELLAQGIRPMPTTAESTAPQAHFLPLLKSDLNVPAFLKEQNKLSDFWVRPFDETDLLEADFNPFLTDEPVATAPVKASATFLFNTDALVFESVVEIDDLSVEGMKLFPERLKRKLSGCMQSILKNQFNAVLDNITEQYLTGEAVKHYLQNLPAINLTEMGDDIVRIELPVSGEIPGLTRSKIPAGIRTKPVKHRLSHPDERLAKYEKTARKRELIKQKDGSEAYRPGLMSLAFYGPRIQSRQGMSYQNYTKQWTLESQSVLRKVMPVVDDVEKALSGLSGRIAFDSARFQEWKADGGLERALNIYYSHISMRMRNWRRKSLTQKRVRVYEGAGQVINECMSAGVAVDKSYYPILKEKICRTQLFDELGLYAFQTLSLPQLDAHPRIKNLEAYRHFKAKYLLSVRQLRNQDRKAIRQQQKAVNSGNAQSLCLRVTDALKDNRLETFSKACNTIMNAVKYHLGVDVVNPEAGPVMRAKSTGYAALDLLTGCSMRNLLNEIMPRDWHLIFKKQGAMRAFQDQAMSHLMDLQQEIDNCLNKLSEYLQIHSDLRKDKQHWLHMCRWHSLLVPIDEVKELYFLPEIDFLISCRKNLENHIKELKKITFETSLAGEQLVLFLG